MRRESCVKQTPQQILNKKLIPNILTRSQIMNFK